MLIPPTQLYLPAQHVKIQPLKPTKIMVWLAPEWWIERESFPFGMGPGPIFSNCKVFNFKGVLQLAPLLNQPQSTKNG